MPKPKKFRYKVLYEDAHLMAIDKPAGLLTVPIPDMPSTNLQQMVQQDFGKRVRPVHRIDRYTSGIVVFSKTGRIHHQLVKQFRNREPRRVYQALVRGRVDPPEATLVHHLKLIKTGFRNIVVNENNPDGTRAELVYKLIKQYPKAALLRVELVTGLKNQIRVQLSEAGLPLIGDRHYSPGEEHEKWINRQALHAAELSIIHPLTQKRLTFRSPIAQDMQKLIDKYKAMK
ncbi:tRNA pseudouridine synthase [Cyclonatronum proteinivorum]|uniref:tRNA pseudouridine synthase n=1 Tax=Cyclonatronum proteinivorum TaxID=1457365 RepID=A0A345UG03_9BACT|nr:RluA family pseudouridine synthase [Cyclonatronum proteinivorum]AXI99404.1 tRNA pseudouridine synthase [Cyclonatronum proteinivorum]